MRSSSVVSLLSRVKLYRAHKKNNLPKFSQLPLHPSFRSHPHLTSPVPPSHPHILFAIKTFFSIFFHTDHPSPAHHEQLLRCGIDTVPVTPLITEILPKAATSSEYVDAIQQASCSGSREQTRSAHQTFKHLDGYPTSQH